VLFGSIAEEIIGTPVDTLIAANEGMGILVPTKITALYGKQYDLRVSVSSMSLQQVNITYQVDAIIGAASISTSTPPPLHLRMSHKKLNLFLQPGSIYLYDLLITLSF